MNREVIAEIRLAPGEVGYYDDYSRIYLSTAKPVAKIYAGMNTTQIRKSIRSGRLRLVSGSLFGPAPVKEEVAPKKQAKEEAKPVEVPKQEAEPVPAEPVISEPVIEEPVIKEPVVEEPVLTEPEIQEETAEEEIKPKRRRSRKKAEIEAE